jgi:protein involved in polysaccharide export with SLBB domain
MRSFFLLISFAFFNASIAQNATESQVLNTAKSMNISTQQQALEALKQKGISESQARQMARMRGVDFDSFLATYFTSSTPNSANPSGSTILPSSIVSTTNVVDAMQVQSTPVLVGVSQENTLSAITKAEADRFFGYEIFLNNPFAQKDYLVGNIDEGYIIAPGDVLRMVVFGDNAMQIEAKVDLNGNITIPNFGVFLAAGNNFGTLKSRLKIYLGKYFSGLLTAPQRTFLDVSLTQIRPVAITVLGEASTPGPHLVNGLATVLNALYAAGGIKTSGSLRSIKVYRNNQMIKEIDLYDYITSGKLDADIRLANNDIIFVSPRLSSISFNGTVKQAGIYELKKNEGLNELIKFSGGLPANASLNNVNVQRITPFENRDQKIVFDRFLTALNYGSLLKVKKNFILENGDAVSVSEVLSKSMNQVKIIGNVNKPGTYPLDKFNNLKDLIMIGAEQLLPNTYLNKVDIEKEDLDGTKRFITYNLNTVLNGDIKVKLENDDIVRVYNLKEVKGDQLIKIGGFGTDPKSVFWREGLSLFDLIFQSTSFEELEFQSKLLTSRVDIKRFNSTSGLFDITQYSLDNLIQLKQTELKPKDEVLLYSKSVFEVVNKTISITGFVNNPGEFKLANKMHVEDAILSAGGFKEYADQDSVIVNRESFDARLGKVSDRFLIPLDINYIKGLSKLPLSSFLLNDNDIISVRKKIGVESRKNIEIQGEVYFPGNVILEFELISFKQILEKAGGLKSTANLNASYIKRGGKIISINLANDIESNKNILIDGDIVFIASENGTVSTIGAVQNENLFIWEKGQKSKYYIRNSGGRIKSEAGDAYLVLPNGKTKKINVFRNPRVLPNAQIVVNRKVNKQEQGNGEKAWDRMIKVITIVTSSLTAAVLASKL